MVSFPGSWHLKTWIIGSGNVNLKSLNEKKELTDKSGD